MRDPIANSYSVLELNPGASREEIKKAYRDLIKVWHPDRFALDEALKVRALEKTKEINRAYELLTSIEPQGAGYATQELSESNFIRVNRFIFYDSSFDETTVGVSLCRSTRASQACTDEFFKVVADWMLKGRWVKCQIRETMPWQFGQQRISHTDLKERVVAYNLSERLTLQSLFMPLAMIFVRDKLLGFPSMNRSDMEEFTRVLKKAGWNGEGVFQGESYLRAEADLAALVTDALLHRLLNKMSWWADTSALFKMKYSESSSLRECASAIAYRVQHEEVRR